jgi:hypothetical protein
MLPLLLLVAMPARADDPPAADRILKIIHGWPDDPKAQDDLITRLSRQGFGGVVSNVSFTNYLEDDSRWTAFVHAVNAAKAAGWSLWLYDERGYPSANAGGLVLKDHPDDEARGLLIAEADTDSSTDVTLARPPGTLVVAAAYPLVDGHIDMTGRVDLSASRSDNTLHWKAPEPATRRWRVLIATEARLYDGTHADGNLHQKMPYPNLLDPEPTARFLALTHDRYAAHLGTDLGRYFESTFTDEPSLMSVFLRPMPYRVLPWSRAMTSEFARRRGHDLNIADTVAQLTFNSTDPAADARLRYDFWLTVAELVSENYFGQIQTWCHQHNLASGGHLLYEEPIVSHVPFYGDIFRSYRRLDAPSIDCLTSLPPEVPWAIARRASSVADLTGHSLVMSETSDHSQRYRTKDDTRPVRNVTEAEIRGTINRLAVAGVNRQTSYYAFAGLDDDALNRLNAWTGRLGAHLTGGHQMTDIATVYPIESLWTRFVPSKHLTRDATDAQEIANIDTAALNALFAHQRDMTVIDAQAIVKSTVDPSGILRHGPLAWRVVILPGVDTLPMAAWERLRDLIRAGGIVVSLGHRPASSETAFPDARVQAIAEEMFGPTSTSGDPSVHVTPSGGAGVWLPQGSEPLLTAALDGLIDPDVRLIGLTPGARPSPLRVTHRQMSDEDHVYLLINDSGAEWSGEVRLSAVTGPGERLDPATGRVQVVADPTSIRLDLEPYAAVLLHFAHAATPARHPSRDGLLPGLSLAPIPVAPGDPAHFNGQYAPSTVTADDGNPAAWDVQSHLTKSDVDTFNFVEWTCQPTADLSGALGLVVEADVPEAQTTGTQLLLIVREQDGGDYLAPTGLSLSSPGHHRAVVPLDRLEPASWSHDPDGHLDPSRIAALRLGWGGYLGQQGESVHFRARVPQAARMGP